jgi:aryl-alcohol dehydrogenase-like predicted oxidoreductase
VELALGTVQFGLPYGIAGRGAPVPEGEVRTILRAAWDAGIRMLDTAAAYGDIEQRLGGLMAELPFKVVTKVSPAPDGLDEATADAWMRSVLERAEKNLGDRLHAVLFHRAEDLFGSNAKVLWNGADEWATRRGCALGASCYEPGTLRLLRERIALRIAQLPANALDQRVRRAGDTGGVEIHLRSAFLQGLLLMPLERATERVPAARLPLQRWHDWVRQRGLDPVVGALGMVKGNEFASHCVVGVDDVGQLEVIVAAWASAPVLQDPALAVDDPDVVDPRHWPKRT